MLKDLREMKALYRRDLLLEPASYKDFKKHLIGLMFEQAERDYLKTYKEIRT
jgi:hypothetical protein